MGHQSPQPSQAGKGLFVLVIGLFGLPGMVSGDPYQTPGPILPPWPNQVDFQQPVNVEGKEFTDSLDRHAHLPLILNPGQIILWDGIPQQPAPPWGGTMDGLVRITDPPLFNLDIDAQANQGDALFVSVKENWATLLFSTAGNDLMVGGIDVPIHYETPVGTSGPWAYDVGSGSPVVDRNVPIENLNSLEVWGPDGVTDTTHVSFVGDPGGSAVYRTAGASTAAGPVFPFISTAEIGAAIGLDSLYWSDLDLDALMMQESITEMMFSIAPVGPFDGGEIWIWDYTNLNPGAAAFLWHGGHLWDTAFDVRGAFGTLSENIDALEAVSATPEASTVVAGGILGLLALGVLRRRWAT
jgi:hypothetical protein